MANWMTTVAGLVPIAYGLIQGIQYIATQHYTGNIWQDLVTVVTGVGLVLAKDFNTTGVGPSATK